MVKKILYSFVATCLISGISVYAVTLPEKLSGELEKFAQIEDISNTDENIESVVTLSDLFAFLDTHKGENLVGTAHLDTIKNVLWYTKGGKKWFKAKSVADQRALCESINWVPRIMEDYATADEVKQYAKQAFYYFPHAMVANTRLKLSESDYQAMLDEIQLSYIGSGNIFENSRDWFKNLLKNLELKGDIQQAYEYVSAEEAAFAHRLADSMDNIEMRKWAGYLSYMKGRLKKDLN